MSRNVGPPGLFIAGTNTEVGKTYVAVEIARALVRGGVKVGVYKPAASGCIARDGSIVSEDAELLWEAAGRPGTLAQVCPQTFLAPLAPHLAARAEGREIDPQLLFDGLDAWRDFDLVLVEGAGGLMSPIADDLFVADLAETTGFPLIVVAANELGVINQTLQTLIAAATFRDGLEVAGIVLNSCRVATDDPSRERNAAEIQRYAYPPLLAQVGYHEPSQLATIDWRSLAGGNSRGSA